MKDCEFDPQDVLKLHKQDKKTVIKIRNLTLEGRAYKIKTTRPREYVVKPSMGIIMPMEEIVIDVKASETCSPDDSHRFLIEIYAFDCRKPLSSLKSHLKDIKTSPIMTHKLGVVFYLQEVYNEFKPESSGVGSNLFATILMSSCVAYIFFLLLFLLLNIFKSNVC